MDKIGGIIARHTGSGAGVGLMVEGANTENWMLAGVGAFVFLAGLAASWAEKKARA